MCASVVTKSAGKVSLGAAISIYLYKHTDSVKQLLLLSLRDGKGTANEADRLFLLVTGYLIGYQQRETIR